MDKEKLEKLWKMVEYVGEKKGLDYNEMIVFGSVFWSTGSGNLETTKRKHKNRKVIRG